MKTHLILAELKDFSIKKVRRIFVLFFWPELTNIFFVFAVCKKSESDDAENSVQDDYKDRPSTSKRLPGTKEFKCTGCDKILYLSSVEILKHKKTCRR